MRRYRDRLSPSAQAGARRPGARGTACAGLPRCGCAGRLVRCVEAADVQFAIVHGISDNRFKRLDITSTRDRLEYAPQDDAFDIFGDHLREWLQD